jgi:hypothetical protein
MGIKVTHDRGEIIHFIGRHHGSPALKKGSNEPLIVGHGPAGEAVKVAWPAFFHEVESKNLAFAFDEETGGHRFIAKGATPPTELPADPSS